MHTKVLDSLKMVWGYDDIYSFYPSLPLLSHWRTWGYGTYQHYHLEEDVTELSQQYRIYGDSIIPVMLITHAHLV